LDRDDDKNDANVDISYVEDDNDGAEYNNFNNHDGFDNDAVKKEED